MSVVLSGSIPKTDLSEAVIARWEHALAVAYGAALDHTLDDTRAQQVVLAAVESAFAHDLVPPTLTELLRLIAVDSCRGLDVPLVATAG